jgi:hypothetical protein
MPRVDGESRKPRLPDRHSNPTPADMRNIAAEPLDPSNPSSLRFSDPHRRNLNPSELAAWLEHHRPWLADRWRREIERRYGTPTRGINGLLGEFLDVLVSFLPGLIGPHRDQVDTLWLRATELFGAVAARRGLAAGEVIDEFQILREGLIRLLYQNPPLGGRLPLSLRDILRLNRAIDSGVTQASVGHTDALFFSLFEGSGIPESPPTSELMFEVRSQLREIGEELTSIVKDPSGRTGPDNRQG